MARAETPITLIHRLIHKYMCKLFFVQVMDLVDKWVSGCVRMRVFTDKWPDCSCAVVFFYQPAEFPYQQSQDLDTKSCQSGM